MNVRRGLLSVAGLAVGFLVAYGFVHLRAATLNVTPFFWQLAPYQYLAGSLVGAFAGYQLENIFDTWS